MNWLISCSSHLNCNQTNIRWTQNYSLLARVCFEFSSPVAAVKARDCPPDKRCPDCTKHVVNELIRPIWLSAWIKLIQLADCRQTQPLGGAAQGEKCKNKRAVNNFQLGSEEERITVRCRLSLRRELQGQPERKHVGWRPCIFTPAMEIKYNLPSFQLAAALKTNQTAPPVISALFCAFQTSRLTRVPENYSPRCPRVDSSRLLCSFLP